MLAMSKIKEAERLLLDGRLSQRKIAALVGISRATVSAIASGRRPDYEARLAARAIELEPLGPIVRCGGCGARVYSPCRACRVRADQDRKRESARAVRHRNDELALRLQMTAARDASLERDAALAQDTIWRRWPSAVRPIANSETSRGLPAA
jgi:transcriptional regulator with XRE-family HTH domain